MSLLQSNKLSIGSPSEAMEEVVVEVGAKEEEEEEEAGAGAMATKVSISH